MKPLLIFSEKQTGIVIYAEKNYDYSCTTDILMWRRGKWSILYRKLKEEPIILTIYFQRISSAIVKEESVIPKLSVNGLVGHPRRYPKQRRIRIEQTTHLVELRLARPLKVLRDSHYDLIQFILLN